jgi:hypothetical protein
VLKTINGKLAQPWRLIREKNDGELVSIERKNRHITGLILTGRKERKG